MRVNDALKKENDLTRDEEEDSDDDDSRIIKPKVSVALVAPD